MQGISFLPGFGKAFDNLDPQKSEILARFAVFFYHTCKVSESFSNGGCVFTFILSIDVSKSKLVVTGLIKDTDNGKSGLSLGSLASILYTSNNR